MRDTRPKTVLVDVDGTIALRGDRDPYAHEHAMEDAVNIPVVNAVEAMVRAYGWKVVIISARKEKYREITDYWLWTHGLFENRAALLMRKNDDQRGDPQVKRDMYEKEIAPHYDVQTVFDDRTRVVKMWRELGLTCFQVAEGDY